MFYHLNQHLNDTTNLDAKKFKKINQPGSHYHLFHISQKPTAYLFQTAL